jgi:hypothetical protein
MARRLAIGVLVAIGLAATIAHPATSGARAPAAALPAQAATPRDARPPAARTGTAVIRGRVVAADGGRPLRRVQIRFTAPELGAPQGRPTSTDEDGRYEIGNLPTGRYTITAVRGGFLSLRYGQRRPREQGKPVEVADGQVVENVDFALPKMSVLSGRITDEEGEPIGGVTVLAMRSTYFDGRRQLVPTSEASVATDDVGEYRIAGLVPGTYVVSARSSDKWTVDAGGREETMGYAPTYFPGTTNIADARRVTVGLGQEVGANDFALIPGRAATVSGTALDSRGQPFQSVNLALEIRSEGGGRFGSAGNARVAADGTFTIRGVAPGDYKLRAARMDNEPEVAILPIVVDGIDLTNVTLTGSAGGTVAGTVVVEEGVTARIPRVQITIAERVVGQPDPTMLGAFRGRYTPVVAAAGDGSFTVRNVFGPALMDVGVPDGWMVKAIGHDGRDIADMPIVLRHGEQLSGVRIMVTDRITSVAGELTDDKGVAVPDGTVIVFTARSDKWFEGSRFVRAARPDQKGRYQIKGLPPGEYLALALDDVEEGAWNDPEYLESLRQRAQRLTLTAGEPQTLSLKLVAVP